MQSPLEPFLGLNILSCIWLLPLPYTFCLLIIVIAEYRKQYLLAYCSGTQHHMSSLSSLKTWLTELSFELFLKKLVWVVANSYRKNPCIFWIPHPNILLSVPKPKFYWCFSRNVKQYWYVVTHFCSSVLLLGEKNSPSLTFFLSLSHFGTGCKDISCVYCVGFPQCNDWKQMCEYAHALSHTHICSYGANEFWLSHRWCNKSIWQVWECCHL